MTLSQTAETPETVEPNPSSQRLVRDRTLTCLAARLAQYQQKPVELQAQLQPHLDTLNALHRKLAQPLLQIAVFGLVSRGKSAVLNALFGEVMFPTGPLNGVTQWPRSVRWSPMTDEESTAAIQLELIDTPGLDEISGEGRASMAQEIARCADLILFVTAGPPLPIEETALAELVQFAKPLLWIVNKADLYPDLSTADLYNTLSNPDVRAILSPQEIILAAAAPAPIQVRHEWPDGRTTTDWEIPPPQVESLRQTLLQLLEREGLSLLALNVLVQTQATERQIADAIATFYETPAQSTQWRIWSLKAALVGILPWIWLDLILSFGADVVQVRQLSQLYGWPATSRNIVQLWKTLLTSVGYVGAAELGTNGLGWVFGGFDGPLGLAPGLVQGAIAIYSAALVGEFAQSYLRNGATWDNQGPSVLIQTILQGLDPETITHRFSASMIQSLESVPAETTPVNSSTEGEGPALVSPSQDGSDGLS